MTKRQSISIRAFAKQIQVSEGGVRKAVKDGKFKIGYDPVAKKIDPVAAKKDIWVQKQSVPIAKAGVSKERAMEKIALQSKSPVRKSAQDPDTPPPGIPITEEEMDTETLLNSIKITSNMDVARTMKLREIVALAIDKKKLEEINGTLVPREKVEKALFNVGSELKKALMNIPPKVVRRIMDAPTEVEGITMLTTAITHVLADYGNLKPNTLS